MIVLALTVSAGLPLSAGPPMTKLRVEVRSSSNKPIDRATVIVRFLSSRSIQRLGFKRRTQWELKTNQDGVASLPSIPQGKIRIQVHAKNYQTFGGEFEVLEEEKTLGIVLNPPQSQYTSHQ
jgi:hypothetical protein